MAALVRFPRQPCNRPYSRGIHRRKPTLPNAGVGLFLRGAMLMTSSRLLLAAVAATGAAALSGCASYDPYGGGYSSVSIGVGTGGYYGGGYGGFGGYGYYPAYGYAQPWGGWYNDYYYPGRGVY